MELIERKNREWAFSGLEKGFYGKSIGTLNRQVYVILQSKSPYKSSRHPADIAIIHANP